MKHFAVDPTGEQAPLKTDEVFDKAAAWEMLDRALTTHQRRQRFRRVGALTGIAVLIALSTVGFLMHSTPSLSPMATVKPGQPPKAPLLATQTLSDAPFSASHASHQHPATSVKLSPQRPWRLKASYPVKHRTEEGKSASVGIATANPSYAILAGTVAEQPGYSAN